MHTHTHWYRPSTVDIHFRVFADHHGLCVCVCVCVSSNYLTMDYPPTPIYISPCLELFLTSMPIRFAIPIGGSLTIVDVHGWCVSTVT